MNETQRRTISRSGWLDWRRKGEDFRTNAEVGPTKPSKLGYEGFEGAAEADHPEIYAESFRVRSARRLLNSAGVRILALEKGFALGVWRDLDGPPIRAAIADLQHDDLPVRYLDGAEIPASYRIRLVPARPVLPDILAEVERNPVAPGAVRDGMLAGQEAQLKLGYVHSALPVNSVTPAPGNGGES